jgi:tetrahydromethanopterin S-methyltransferase subunit G
MTVEERLAAVERAVTDDEVEPAALSDAATVERRLDDLETQLDSTVKTLYR